MTDSAPIDLPSCSNCLHPITGNFCAHCGQEVKEIRRPILFLLRDAFSSVFELDGRAWRTLFALMTRPGFLSREYVSGRRVRYTPPLRLFLVISIGFFLIVSAFTSLQSIRNSIADPDRPSSVAETPTPFITADGADNQDSFGGVFAFIDNFHLPVLSEQRNENLRRYMRTQSEKNLEALQADPSGYFSESLDYITVFMLLMMPILALIQKLLYYFSKRFYVEHLILTLHNHAFLVLAVFLSSSVSVLEEMSVPVVSAAMGVAGNLIGIWIVVYLFMSLKNFFGQGYAITVVKFITMAFLYGGVTAAGILSFAAVLFFLF